MLLWLVSKKQLLYDHPFRYSRYSNRFDVLSAKYYCLQFKNHLKTAVDILYADPSAETFSMEPLATIQPNELYSIPIDKAQSYDYYIRRNGLG